MIRRQNIELELLKLGCKIYDWNRAHQDLSWQLYHPLPIGYRTSIEQLSKIHGEMTRVLNETLAKLHGVLELLSNIFGDTADGLTGSEIHRFLLQAEIADISENESFLAKRKRLFNAFANFQNTHNCCNNILKFIQLVLTPSRFIGKSDEFEALRAKVNQQLAFEGYEIKENGKFVLTQKASVISDVELKVENLKQELTNRNAHAQIFRYCTPELLSNNYFHSVFEASKGLFQRIRDLSGLTTDGNTLIEQVFSSNPVLIINNYQTKQEKDEHVGFCNLLKGLCGMFRNPEAHQPKIFWDIDEQDALEILGLISYCHRRLDKAQKIRIV